jgi:hypothetical protein
MATHLLYVRMLKGQTVHLLFHIQMGAHLYPYEYVERLPLHKGVSDLPSVLYVQVYRLMYIIKATRNAASSIYSTNTLAEFLEPERSSYTWIRAPEKSTPPIR